MDDALRSVADRTISDPEVIFLPVDISSEGADETMIIMITGITPRLNPD